MKISELIAGEEKFGKGDFEIVRVPARLQPSHDTLCRVDLEIASQISENERISKRSMQNAAASIG